MEIALDAAIPTYAGGLGVLAGDTLRSAADLGAPIVGVTLLHRSGYFRQSLDADGRQSEAPDIWRPENVLERVDATADIALGGRRILIQAWKYSIEGGAGQAVPVYLLDTRHPENDSEDQVLTEELYGGNHARRLSQEALLGLGGVRLLRALGYDAIETFHMNEGHSALLALELLEEWLGERPTDSATEKDIMMVRRRCVFTTHTPVPAGHDRFSRELAREVLGDERINALERLGAFPDGELNMTYLALRASHYVNGVAMQHGRISHGMFPTYPIAAITNGVHAATWTSPPMRALFDRYVAPWRRDNLYLRYAVGIPASEVAAAHREAKGEVLKRIHEQCGRELDPEALTIGFARRATAYKRADLVFHDLDRLLEIARRTGRIQLIFGGKAHPQDETGKKQIESIFAAAKALGDAVPVVYVEDYGLEWASYLVSGCDLWLNTPLRPLEASGTSGMKAALNGVPSLSVLDGWWIEGWIEGVTGWAIESPETAEDAEQEAASLYDKLGRVIAPMFFGRPEAYANVMRSAIAINGSYFNTERMVQQYLGNAYFPGEGCSRGRGAPAQEEGAQ
jgi:starch phosphorylase